MHETDSPIFHISQVGLKSLMWPVTDLLEISSLQGLVPHLTEVHVTVVMALLPLKGARQTHVSRTADEHRATNAITRTVTNASPNLQTGRRVPVAGFQEAAQWRLPVGTLTEAEAKLGVAKATWQNSKWWWCSFLSLTTNIWRHWKLLVNVFTMLF